MSKFVFIPNLLLVLTIATLSQAIAAENTIFTASPLPEFSLSTQQRKQQNQQYYLGEASFANGVKVPMYGITALSPASDKIVQNFKPCKTEPAFCQFQYMLPPKHAASFKLVYITNNRSFLVPRTWTDIQASLGANGSAFILFKSPDGEEAISFEDTSLCAGCGMSSASLFFPEARQEALENEFMTIQDQHHLIKMVHANKNQVFYSYQKPNYPNKTHGVAFFWNENNLVNYKQIEVSLLPKHQQLATPMLNFYLSGLPTYIGIEP